MNAAPATAQIPAATVKIRGLEYKRTGRPVYYIQVQSASGGYLSTAVTTENRAYVGDFARAQAELVQAAALAQFLDKIKKATR